MIDFQEIIEQIYRNVKDLKIQGDVANYIPALANINPSQYGIAIATVDGKVFGVGNCETPFSVQSISKVFTLAMVVRHKGENLWKYVGREPSGNAFNSLVQLEHEEGVPRNPFINAGALVVTDKLIDLYENPNRAILSFLHHLSGNPNIEYNKEVASSEIEHSSRNQALSYFMKSFGNINNEISSLIDVYCHQCSIEMSCVDLAKSFLFLTNHGTNPLNNEQILTISQSKRINALMLTCGFYDESGDFAFRVGLPGKSGVGGGIVAIIPEKLSIAVWSPPLNSFGNSCKGIETLERFTTKIGISIF